MRHLLRVLIALYSCCVQSTPVASVPLAASQGRSPKPTVSALTSTLLPLFTPTPVKQWDPSTVVGLYRKCRTTGQEVPVMTFGNPSREGNIAPYFVAVEFGDARGIVYGTFDYLESGRACQFTSMDQTQQAKGMRNGSAEVMQVFPGIACPPIDARTVRNQLNLANHHLMPSWTVSVNAARITTTLSTYSSWASPSQTAVSLLSSSGDIKYQGITLAIVLGSLFVVGCLVIFCIMRSSLGGNEHDEPRMPVAQGNGNLLASPLRNPTSSRQHTYLAGSSAPPFSTQDALAFLAQHPFHHFPMDAQTFSSMQLSPAQWDFVSPSFEYQTLLAPFMSFDPGKSTFSLFPAMNSANHTTARHRPYALSVQTRLPVPIPPRDSLSFDSPYSGIRVPPTLYCEFRIVDCHSPAIAIAIGLACGPYPTFKLPGCHRWSVAYHSQTGALHMGTSSGSASTSKYGPKFGKGDVVGIGVNTDARYMFFTVNRVKLPMAVELPLGKEAVYPTVGATGPCEVEYNFGTQEFRWKGSEGSPGMVDANDVCNEEVEVSGFLMDTLPAYVG